MPYNPAVFSRNHAEYLAWAAKIAVTDSERLVTFRSSKGWVKARELLEHSVDNRLAIYFAVIDQGPEVKYKAWLRGILLKPNSGDEQIQRLLRFVPPPTKEEGVWHEDKGSFYVISGCYQLEQPFPISELKKLDGGTALSVDYGYSYSIVYEIDDRVVSNTPVAQDVAPPPPRTEAIVKRIIRDTSIVTRLKQLHNHQCQRCSTQLEIEDGKLYSEGHHIQPLGTPHNGPDIEANIIILCPNCHAILDYSAQELNIDSLRQHPGHKIGLEFIHYHNKLVTDRKKRAC
jgi:hypothetical protein